MKKKLFKYIVLVISIFILFNIVEEIRGLHQEEINKSIDSYFNKESLNAEEGKTKIYSYINLDNSKLGIITEQYSLVKSAVYYYDGESRSSDSYPVKFKILSFAGFSKVISCTLQTEENLPDNILEDIKNNTDKYEKSLTDSNSQKIKLLKDTK